MNYLYALIGGLVEGLTAVLPVSASGHRAIYEEVAERPAPAAMGIAVALALALIFRKELSACLGGLKKTREQRKKGRFIWSKAAHHQKVLVYAPLAAIPYWAVCFCKAQFGFLSGLDTNLILASVMFFITAGMLFIGDHSICKRWTAKEMSAGHAVKLSLFQAVAVLPGLSMPALTLCMGRNMGYEKDAMVDFTVLSMLFALVGGDLAALPSNLPAELGPWAVAFVGCFGAALLGGWLLKKLLQKERLSNLLFYAIAAGIAAIVLASL